MCLRQNLRHLIRVVMHVLQLRVHLCWQNTINGKLGMLLTCILLQLHKIRLIEHGCIAAWKWTTPLLYFPKDVFLSSWFHLPMNWNCTCMTFKSVLTLSSIKSNHCVFKKHERSGLCRPIPCTTPSLLWDKGGLKTIGLCFLGQWVWVPKNRQRYGGTLWIRAERRPRDPNALVEHT